MAFRSALWLPELLASSPALPCIVKYSGNSAWCPSASPPSLQDLNSYKDCSCYQKNCAYFLELMACLWSVKQHAILFCRRSVDVLLPSRTIKFASVLLPCRRLADPTESVSCWFRPSVVLMWLPSPHWVVDRCPFLFKLHVRLWWTCLLPKFAFLDPF
jgi:hypothetical protein